MHERRTPIHWTNGSTVVATIVIGLMAASILAGCSGSAGSETSDAEPLPQDGEAIAAAAAEAIGEVTSVGFELTRSGAPVAIDPFGVLLLESVVGRAVLPNRADAVVTVNVGGSLITELGAVAIDDEVWMSNPITGEMEPLPEGINIDPREFFNPTQAWKPLLEELTAPVFIESQDDLYHIQGTASSPNLSAITAGLIQDQDLTLDLWIDPTDALIRRVEFESTLGGETSQWVLTLSDFGATFDIARPDAAG